MFDDILRMILLILALLGGGAFLYRKFSMKVELIPITVFFIIILVLFVAGILNLLKIATLLLLVAGLCLLVYSIAGAGLRPWKLWELLTPGTIFLLCGIVYFSFFFVGVRLITYDSFSHWALIVKQMLYDNRLPNFQNDLIMFQSYPPGSALFLYFVTKTIGPSEGRMMFAQTLLILGGLTTFFSFVDQRLTLAKKALMTLLITTSSLVLLTMDTYLYDLPVDTLLPVCALAGVVSIFQSRDDLRLCLFFAALNSSVVILIKNSGVLFAVLNVLLFAGIALIRSRESVRFRRRLASLVICAAVPFFVLLVWRQHTFLAFPNVMDSKHFMSAESYSKAYCAKSVADKDEIVDSFAARAGDLTKANRQMLILNLTLLAAALLLLLRKRREWRTFVLTIVGINVVYLVYQVGLCGMYLFSMPTGEAKALASFDRYEASMMVYLLGSAFALLYNQMSGFLLEGRFRIEQAAALVLSAAMTAALWHPAVKMVWVTPPYENTVPAKIDVVLNGYEADPTKKYLIYMPSSENDNDYARFILRYKLYTMKCSLARACEDYEAFRETLSGYDVLIVIDWDEDISGLIDGAGLEPNELGFYDLLSNADEAR